MLSIKNGKYEKESFKEFIHYKRNHVKIFKEPYMNQLCNLDLYAYLNELVKKLIHENILKEMSQND